MLKAILLHQLARAINRVLATDPLAFADLTDLAGKSVHIECLPLKTPIYLLITPHGVQLQTQLEGPASVHLRGKAVDLLKFARSPDQTKMLMDEHVSLQGEIDVLLKLKQIAAITQLDLEGLVAEVIGDTAANRLGLVATKLVRHARSSLQSLKQSTTLYLQEESGLLASQPEVEQFIQDVNQLRQDLERLQARSQRLSRGIHHGS